MCKLLSQLTEHWPPERWRSVSILVAVSGGPDSVALLRALHELTAKFEGDSNLLQVAHYNHGWRDSASDDECFVQKMCAELNLPCHVGGETSNSNSTEQDRSEDTARRDRYAFLQATAESVGARYLALGHTADDQVETILHRILRGSGLRGLSGIPMTRVLSEAVVIVRPLLTSPRADVLQYLTSIDQSYCKDESNADTSYTRNRIRRELLPQLRSEYNAEVDSAIKRLGEHAIEAQELIDALTVELYELAVTIQDAKVFCVVELLQLAAPLVQRELFRHIWRKMKWPEQAMTGQRWHELAGLLKPNSPCAVTMPGNIHAQRKNDQIVIGL